MVNGSTSTGTVTVGGKTIAVTVVSGTPKPSGSGVPTKQPGESERIFQQRKAAIFKALKKLQGKFGGLRGAKGEISAQIRRLIADIETVQSERGLTEAQATSFVVGREGALRELANIQTRLRKKRATPGEIARLRQKFESSFGSGTFSLVEEKLTIPQLKAIRKQQIVLTAQEKARIGGIVGLRGQALISFLKKATPEERAELLRGTGTTVGVSERTGRVFVETQPDARILFEPRPDIPKPDIILDEPPTTIADIFRTPEGKIRKPSEIFETIISEPKKELIEVGKRDIPTGFFAGFGVTTLEAASLAGKAAFGSLEVIPSIPSKIKKAPEFIREEVIPTTTRLTKQLLLGTKEAVKSPGEFAIFGGGVVGGIALAQAKGIKKEFKESPGLFVGKTVTELALGGVALGEAEAVFKATKFGRRFFEEPRFVSKVPKDLKKTTKVILETARLGEVAKPPLRTIRFKEIKTLSPIEARAVKQTLLELGPSKTLVFGSAAGRAAGLKTIPKDIDIGVKSISEFKKVLGRKSKELGIKSPSAKLDVKDIGRLTPERTLLGLGPGRLPTPTPRGIPPVLIPTKKPKIVEGIKITAFGEQLQRKGLGSLQVVLEKSPRRAKDPAAFVESLKLAKVTIEKVKPLTPIGLVIQRRRVKKLGKGIEFLESPSFRKTLKATQPAALGKFPKLPRVKAKPITPTIPTKEGPKGIAPTRPSGLPKVTKPSKIPDFIGKPSKLPSTLSSQLKGSKFGRSVLGISKIPSKVPSVFKPSKIPPTKIPPSKVPPSIIKTPKVPSLIFGLPSVLRPSQFGPSQIITPSITFRPPPPPEKVLKIKLGKEEKKPKKKIKEFEESRVFKPSLGAVLGKVVATPAEAKKLLTGKLDPIGQRALVLSDPISRRVLGLAPLTPRRGGLF